MRPIVLAVMICCSFLAAGLAHAASSYQSCSQGDLPLVAPFPPATDSDLNTYMHYTVYKDGNLNDILMWGRIDRCDEKRLRQVLDLARPVGTISLISGGGDLAEAMAMGRTLRDFGAKVIIEDGNSCISACNFLYMGGAIRMIEPSADFEVHMFDNSAADTLQAELANPPDDLASFLELFPFRSDVTMEEVNSDVQNRNDAAHKMVAELTQIEQTLGSSGPVAASSAAQAGQNASAGNGEAKAASAAAASAPSANAPLPADEATAIVSTANADCDPFLDVDLTSNATLDTERRYISTCINILSKPYTAEDWFSDQARIEDVKAIQQQAAGVAAQIARYLSEMSISLRFLTDFANTPNSKPKQLSVDELRDLNIVNAD